jgi:hypothetical protein
MICHAAARFNLEIRATVTRSPDGVRETYEIRKSTDGAAPVLAPVDESNEWDEVFKENDGTH